MDILKKIKVTTKEGEIREIDATLLKYLCQLYQKSKNWNTDLFDSLLSESREEILSGVQSPSTFDLNFLKAASEVGGMKASPVSHRKESNREEKIFLGYPTLPPLAFGVEWEIRGLKNGRVNLRLGDLKEKIERKISSMIDPIELGRMYEDGFLISLDTYKSVFGTSAQEFGTRLRTISDRRREIGRLIQDKLFYFTDPHEFEVLEVRSPPCSDPQSLERFLFLTKDVINEVQRTTDFSFVPFGVIDNETLYSANINVHVKIPTPQDLKSLGFNVSYRDYSKVPLIMANTLRNYYAVLTSHSRNSVRQNSELYWLEKFMQIREYQSTLEEGEQKDFMVGNRFTWRNFNRSVSGLFRPNVGLRNEYWTIEVNMDGQASVPEISADAQLIAGLAFKQLEVLDNKQGVERNYLTPEIERIILNEELAWTVQKKNPVAFLPAMSDVKDFTRVLEYTIVKDPSVAIESMVDSGILKQVPMSQVRSDIAKYVAQFWKPTSAVLSLMTTTQPESGSYRQKVETEKSGYQEMVAKSSDNLYKDKKWRA